MLFLTAVVWVILGFILSMDGGKDYAIVFLLCGVIMMIANATGCIVKALKRLEK